MCSFTPTYYVIFCVFKVFLKKGGGRGCVPFFWTDHEICELQHWNLPKQLLLWRIIWNNEEETVMEPPLSPIIAILESSLLGSKKLHIPPFPFLSIWNFRPFRKFTFRIYLQIMYYIWKYQNCVRIE